MKNSAKRGYGTLKIESAKAFRIRQLFQPFKGVFQCYFFRNYYGIVLVYYGLNFNENSSHNCQLKEY